MMTWEGFPKVLAQNAALNLHIEYARHSFDLHICCSVLQNENSPLGYHLCKLPKATPDPKRKD